MADAEIGFMIVQSAVGMAPLEAVGVLAAGEDEGTEEAEGADDDAALVPLLLLHPAVRRPIPPSSMTRAEALRSYMELPPLVVQDELVRILSY
jgi:hypothetical protein